MVKNRRNKQILLISDIVGHSKVGMAAMQPILSYLGFPTFNLPTAVVSNNFAYGDYSVLDTSEYISRTLSVWKRLGFHSDAICTGWMYNEDEAQMIARFCQEEAAGGTLIFVDPVMADGGQLYKGMSQTHIDAMRRMVAVADLIFPNYTEASLLTGLPFKAEGMNSDEWHELVDQLRQLGAKSVLVTSCKVDGKHAVVGYNHQNGQYFQHNYQEIPIQFPGTGDIFSAVLIGHLLSGEHLEQATKHAMEVVYRLIDLNKENEDVNEGIPLENFLHIINEQ